MWCFTQRRAPVATRSRRLHLDILETRVTPASLTVNTLLDGNIFDDGALSLREAVLLVNNGGNAIAALGRNLSFGESAQISGTFGSNDTISFPTSFDNQTLRLNGTQIDITRSVTIIAPVFHKFTIDANNASRAFNIDDGTQTQINVRFVGPGSTENFALIITNGNATMGGGISNTENLTLAGCSVSGNHATYGGGIYNAGTLTLEPACFLASNTANEGGGIYNTGSLVGDTSFVRANTGGAIRNTGVATFNSVNFASNNGGDGGAIANSGQLSVISCPFTNNTAIRGGAIANFAGGITTIRGIVAGVGREYAFERNSASEGGALYNETNSTMTLLGAGWCQWNLSHVGGAVANRGNFSSDGAGFNWNSSDRSVGAFDNSGTATLVNGGFFANTASNSAGAINNTGTMTLTNMTFTLNTAGEGNGGGGVYNAGTLFISNALFTLNRATYGGAIDNYGGTLTVTNTSFTQNTATGIDGGGAILNSGQLTSAGCTFSVNAADNGYGGAVHNIGASSLAVISGALVENNHALAGGGLFNNDFATMRLGGADTIRGNYVREGNGGGGVYNRGTFTVLPAALVRFESNTATYGGAFYNAGGKATLLNCVFTLNTATSLNGGGAINNTATMTVTASTIENNSSKGHGGGIANYGNLTVSTSTIRGNRADSDGNGTGKGGGIYSTTRVYLHANTITGNFVGTGSTISNLFGGPFVNF